MFCQLPRILKCVKICAVAGKSTPQYVLHHFNPISLASLAHFERIKFQVVTLITKQPVWSFTLTCLLEEYSVMNNVILDYNKTTFGEKVYW